MYISEFSLWVSSAHEKFLEAKKVLLDSKNDPTNEPYKSKYKARDIFGAIAMDLENKWNTLQTMQVKLIYFFVRYEIGVISIDTDECSLGCDILTNIWEEVREETLHPEFAYLALNVLNHLAVLWSERGEFEKALDLLKEAEKLYHDYKTCNDICPYDSEVVFTMETADRSDWSLFEKGLTYTFYYMAQVYEHLQENSNSAKYCRETLKRQLKSGDFETSEWAMNCATLSQYYVQEKMFPEARHLLSCAALVLFKYEVKIERDIEENRELWMAVHQHKASLSYCWVKFCINLLKNTNFSKSKQEEQQIVDCLMDDEEVKKIEHRIPYPVMTYDEAKTVFIFSQNHISVAKSFYTLNEYANTYAQITQDHSRLFNALAFLDDDLGRQCKMHKRRLDMLEELLNKLNPQFYLSVCRQLQFEIGEVCYEMSDIKTRTGSKRSEQKVNLLTIKGIKFFQDFVDSLKDKDGNYPKEFADDIARPALVAHFYIAKNYSKVMEEDSNKKRSNLMKTEECYQFIVDYVEKNPHHECHVETELPFIKEMLEFMPQRIKHLL